MPASPEAVKSWMDVAQPAIGVALVAVLSFVAAYFARKKDGLSETPTSEIVNNSLGAAFMDKQAGGALQRIDQNVQRLVDFAVARQDKEHDQELIEQAAERLRREIEAREKDKTPPRRQT